VYAVGVAITLNERDAPANVRANIMVRDENPRKWKVKTASPF